MAIDRKRERDEGNKRDCSERNAVLRSWEDMNGELVVNAPEELERWGTSRVT